MQQVTELEILYLPEKRARATREPGSGVRAHRGWKKRGPDQVLHTSSTPGALDSFWHH